MLRAPSSLARNELRVLLAAGRFAFYSTAAKWPSPVPCKTLSMCCAGCSARQRLCPVLFMDQDSTNCCHFLALRWCWYWYFAPHRLSKPVLNRGTRLCIPAALNLHASSPQARGLVPIKMQQVLSEDIDKLSHIRGAGLFYSTWISLGVSFICSVPDSPHHFKLPKLTLRMHSGVFLVSPRREPQWKSSLWVFWWN